MVTAIAESFRGMAVYGGPLTGLAAIMEVPSARIGEVEAALRRIASEEPEWADDPVPSAASGALMWFESLLGGQPRDTLFAEAVSRLAQAGDPSARWLDEDYREHEEWARAKVSCGSDDYDCDDALPF